MRDGAEVVFLQKRLGFVKLALQTGSELVPAFTFGQSTMCAFASFCSSQFRILRFCFLRSAAVATGG